MPCLGAAASPIYMSLDDAFTAGNVETTLSFESTGNAFVEAAVEPTSVVVRAATALLTSAVAPTSASSTHRDR